MGGFNNLQFVVLLLTAACCAVPALLHKQLEKSNDDTAKMTGHADRIREKRGRFSFGTSLLFRTWNAVQRILQGAKEIRVETKFRYFQKRGSYKQALRDFEAVDPTDVHSFKTSDGVHCRVGDVGDVSLMIKTLGNGGKAVMEITTSEATKTSGELTHIIVYLNNVH